MSPFAVTYHPLLLHITLCCYMSPFVVTYHPLLLHITLCYYMSPFVVTYHPLLKSFQSLINKHLNILYLDENAKEVFMPGPMVTFHSIRKLSSYLVRATLHPLERVTGSCK